jgi:hypothetical protein
VSLEVSLVVSLVVSLEEPQVELLVVELLVVSQVV